MCCIKCLIPEHSIDGEVLDWCELFLLTQLVEHAGTDSSGVGTKDVLLSLFQFPVILIAGEEGGGDSTCNYWLPYCQI